MFFTLVFRDQLQDFWVYRVFFQVDRWNSVLLREKTRNFLIANVPEPRERIAKVLPGAVLLVLRLPQLRERD